MEINIRKDNEIDKQRKQKVRNVNKEKRKIDENGTKEKTEKMSEKCLRSKYEIRNMKNQDRKCGKGNANHEIYNM